MRIRRVLACFLLVGAMVMVLPGVAGAETTKSELTECLEKASQKPTDSEVNTAAEDCYKAPNLVTPAVSEILWGAAAFAIVLFVLVKFAFPALKQAMKAREEKIRDDLEAAERARTEAETEATQYRAQLADARGEAGRIIEEARQAADDVRKDLIARAEADAAEVRQRAQEDARLASERVMADLQARVSDLSIELAERIVERNLDRDTQMALIESYINEVGSSR
jgi:F-type H+-transporting ATPase subunit b